MWYWSFSISDRAEPRKPFFRVRKILISGLVMVWSCWRAKAVRGGSCADGGGGRRSRDIATDF